MATFKRRHNHEHISDKTEARWPLRLIRGCFDDVWRALKAAGIVDSGGTVIIGGGGSGGGGSSVPLTAFDVDWVANGPYRADDSVDGAWVVPTDCAISKIKVWRGVAGRAGTTILDVKRNGSSLYSTPANRPTIAYSDGDDFALSCILPDVLTLAENDKITIDTLTKETGSPRDWRLSLEAA